MLWKSKHLSIIHATGLAYSVPRNHPTLSLHCTAYRVVSFSKHENALNSLTNPRKALYAKLQFWKPFFKTGYKQILQMRSVCLHPRAVIATYFHNQHTRTKIYFIHILHAHPRNRLAKQAHLLYDIQTYILYSKVRESEIFTVLTCKPCKLPFAAFYQLPSPLPELCYNLNIFFTSYTHANICYLLLL